MSAAEQAGTVAGVIAFIVVASVVVGLVLALIIGVSYYLLARPRVGLLGAIFHKRILAISLGLGVLVVVVRLFTVGFFT